jgi:hypothetical protein
MKSIVDEGLAMRDYHERLRSELRNVCDQYARGQDPAICMELIIGLGERQRPPMEMTFAESQKLKRNWGSNDWRKRHIAMRRAIERGGGDPNDAQMHPRPVSGSKYTHIGISEEDRAAAAAKAKDRAEWIAERLAKADKFMQGANAPKRGDDHVSGWTPSPLTKAEWDRVIKPDDASALPSAPYVMCPTCSEPVTDKQLEACRQGQCPQPDHE